MEKSTSIIEKLNNVMLFGPLLERPKKSIGVANILIDADGGDRDNISFRQKSPIFFESRESAIICVIF